MAAAGRVNSGKLDNRKLTHYPEITLLDRADRPCENKTSRREIAGCNPLKKRLWRYRLRVRT
jgi:hypothetical protein